MTEVSRRALEIEGLIVRYGSVAAVQGVSLHVGEGEVVALLGPNGAGKTSVLSAVLGIAPVAGGKVSLFGEPATRLRPEAVVRRGVALSPEGRRIFPRLTVEQNLRLGAAIVRDGRVRSARREYVLDLFPVLADRLTQMAGTLSGGQQQMLAIARALMSGPQLLLLDEPSLGLAPVVVDKIFELVVRLREAGVTVLLVEQNVRRSLEIADRAYVLASGRVRADGRADDLLAAGGIEEAYLGLEVTR